MAKCCFCLGDTHDPQRMKNNNCHVCWLFIQWNYLVRTNRTFNILFCLNRMLNETWHSHQPKLYFLLFCLPMNIFTSTETLTSMHLHFYSIYPADLDGQFQFIAQIHFFNDLFTSSFKSKPYPISAFTVVTSEGNNMQDRWNLATGMEKVRQQRRKTQCYFQWTQVKQKM